MNKRQNNFSERSHSDKSQNYLLTETLKQGIQFRKYQKKITHSKNSDIKEGFSTQPTNYGLQSYSVLMQNAFNDSDVSNLQSTNQKYSLLLEQNPIKPDASQDVNIDKTSQELNKFASTIGTSTNNILNKTSKVNSQIDKNTSDFSNTLTNLNAINSVAKERYLDNIRGIARDSDILVLQENYKYLLWSILAVGVVSLALNFLKNDVSK